MTHISIPTNPTADKVLELAERRKVVAAEAAAKLAEVEQIDDDLNALLMPPRRGGPLDATVVGATNGNGHSNGHANGNGHSNGNGHHAAPAARRMKRPRPAATSPSAKRAARAKIRHAGTPVLVPKTDRIVKAIVSLGGTSHAIGDISRQARTDRAETTWRLRQARERGIIRRFPNHRYGLPLT